MTKILKITLSIIGIVIIILVLYYINNYFEIIDKPLTSVQNEDQNMEIEISTQDYDELLYAENENTVVIFPLFTGFAYEKNGFYDYYNGKCDESCLTVKISDKFPLHYASSQQGFMIFQLLEYPYLTDLEVSKNPDILKNYDKIILLHNEYVTKKMFDVIISHPNVIYLYPNALYAEVSFNSENNSITLIRGHGYPDKGIANGFDWEFENTHPYEYDVDCVNWNFYNITNGKMLNCYPENVITEKLDIIREIKKY